MVVASTVGSGVVRRVVFLIFVVVVVRMLVVVVVVVVIVIDVVVVVEINGVVEVIVVGVLLVVRVLVVVVEINGVVEVIIVGVLLVVRVLVLDVLMVGSIGRVAVSSKSFELRNQICYTNLEFPLLVERQYQHLKNIFRETISDEFQMFKTCFKLSLTNLIFLTGVWFRRYTKLTKYIKIATFLAKFAADKDLT